MLAYRTLGLGDLLTAVPALRALVRAFPADRVLVCAPAPLGQLMPLIDRRLGFLRTAELDPPEVDAPDAAVNLHGRGPQSHRALLRTRPGRLLAFAHEAVPASWGAPEWDPEEHEVDRWCRLVQTHGIPADPEDLDLDAPAGAVPEIAGGATLIHPGAAFPARRWPVERWAAVARSEKTSGRPVIVTGSAEERTLALEVCRRADLPPDRSLAGRTTLRTLAATVAAASRVVCGDTGVAHLATALRTPSVVLFGPTTPSRWGPPPGRGPHVVLWAGRIGDPHGNRPDPSLLEISVDQVVEALGSLPDPDALRTVPAAS